MDRRHFLAAMAALSATACQQGSAPPTPGGRFVGADVERGHRLRSGNFPPASETRRHEVLILGGGVAGLAAAWRLQRAGHRDFALYEMQSAVGGNARSGENASGRYPLGAHYLPLPPPEARAVRTLLADLGVLRGSIEAPHYDERYLCHAPQERLYRNGRWQEGVVPAHGLSEQETAQMRAFFAHMQRFKAARGRDGRRAFTVPRAYASRDPRYTALDRTDMARWMHENGYTAAPLHWYVDYACRDDFGTRHRDTSAWAGIHYFACRGDTAGESAGEGDLVLTAPGGNGWITDALATRLAAHLHTDAMTIALGTRPQGGGWAEVFFPVTAQTVRIEARQLIVALPLMLTQRLWRDAPAALTAYARTLDYAPWLVANLSLQALPQERRGAPLAWDNVLYDSPGLGYVHAGHQLLQTRPGPTVFTYYHALADDPAAGRRALLEHSHAAWSAQIMAELTRVHPDLPTLTQDIEIARYGHAMARPRPGRVWLAARDQLLQSAGAIHLAHADLSGFSIFEEAHYHGVCAAEAVLRALGQSERSLL